MWTNFTFLGRNFYILLINYQAYYPYTFNTYGTAMTENFIYRSSTNTGINFTCQWTRTEIFLCLMEFEPPDSLCVCHKLHWAFQYWRRIFTRLIVTTSALFVYIQETDQLFQDVRELARREPSEEKSKLIGLLLKCELVELVQKMWRRYFTPEQLDQMNDLPPHLFSSLGVNRPPTHFSFLC